MALFAHELSDEALLAIASATIDPRHDHLDALMDEREPDRSPELGAKTDVRRV